jgi:hypothetical protein
MSPIANSLASYTYRAAIMDLERVIAEFNRLQAERRIQNYAIGGAVAAEAYGPPTGTEDVDVFVVLSPSESSALVVDLTPIWSDLGKHGARFEGEHFVIGGWPVDILPPGTPLYDDAIEAATNRRVGSQLARIMTAEHLAAIALHAGRPKDHVRLLDFLKRGVVDRNKLDSLIDRFHLGEQWKSFKEKYLSDSI